MTNGLVNSIVLQDTEGSQTARCRLSGSQHITHMWWTC